MSTDFPVFYVYFKAIIGYNTDKPDLERKIAVVRKRITDVEREIMQDIAQNIQKILRRTGMSQKELAERTSLSQSAISDYVNAKTLAAPSIVQTIAEALGVPAREIQTSLEKVDTTFAPKKIPVIGDVFKVSKKILEHDIIEHVYYPHPNKEQPDFALKVENNLMSGVGIREGDIVFLRQASWAEQNGQIVAAIAHGEYGVLYRMKWSEASPTITLHSENKKGYDAIEAMPNEIVVLGIYMGHFRTIEEEE